MLTYYHSQVNKFFVQKNTCNSINNDVVLNCRVARCVWANFAEPNIMSKPGKAPTECSYNIVKRFVKNDLIFIKICYYQTIKFESCDYIK